MARVTFDGAEFKMDVHFNHNLRDKKPREENIYAAGKAVNEFEVMKRMDALREKMNKKEFDFIVQEIRPSDVRTRVNGNGTYCIDPSPFLGMVQDGKKLMKTLSAQMEYLYNKIEFDELTIVVPTLWDIVKVLKVWIQYKIHIILRYVPMIFVPMSEEEISRTFANESVPVYGLSQPLPGYNKAERHIVVMSHRKHQEEHYARTAAILVLVGDESSDD